MRVRRGRRCLNADNRWDSFSWLAKGMRVLILKQSSLSLGEECIIWAETVPLKHLELVLPINTDIYTFVLYSFF